MVEYVSFPPDPISLARASSFQTYRHVFGTATGRVKTGATAENQAGVQSDVNSLQAQRAARRLARLTRLEKNQSSASLNGHTAPGKLRSSLFLYFWFS